MKAITLISILALGLLLGCSGDSATTDSNATTSSGTPVASQEMEKCGGCGKEVAKTTLVAHDGKMMCADCIASHNH